MSNFPADCWYNEVVEIDEIDQGDLLESIEFYPTVRVNGVVLTQTCDVPGCDAILIARVYSLADFVAETKRGSNLEGKDLNEKRCIEYFTGIAKQQIFRYHILNEFTGQERQYPFMFVDFATTAMVTKATAQKCIASVEAMGMKRLRLLSPYRERLAQDYSRFISRIGCPKDIDRGALSERIKQAFAETTN